MPLTAGLVGAQAAIGLGQSLFSGKGRKQRELEQAAQNAPQYTGGQGVMDYYQQALNRANVPVGQSAMYGLMQKQADRGLGTGLSALQGSRNALAGVGGLVAGQEDASQRAAVAGQQQQNQAFQQLGGAAEAANQVQNQKYQYNQLNPYQTNLNLKAMKAASAAQSQQAGIQNIFNAAGSGSIMAYNKDKKTKTPPPVFFGAIGKGSPTAPTVPIGSNIVQAENTPEQLPFRGTGPSIQGVNRTPAVMLGWE